MKKRINKFIEKDLNNQYQTNIEIENILNDLNIEPNNGKAVSYYEKLTSQYLRVTKFVVATCLILVLTIVCAFTIRQNQLIKIIHNQMNFSGISALEELYLTNDEFEELVSKSNRLSRNPICSFQNIPNVCIYVYYGKDKYIANYFILVHFLETPNEPLKVFVNDQEVISTKTRFVDHVLQLDLSQEDVEDCLDFVVKYKNTSQRFVVFSPING